MGRAYEVVNSVPEDSSIIWKKGSELAPGDFFYEADGRFFVVGEVKEIDGRIFAELKNINRYSVAPKTLIMKPHQRVRVYKRGS